MSILRRSPNHSPSPQEQRDYKDEVVATLEASGLDKETILIMGGSALALLGIRRAGDVDAMIPHSVFKEIEIAGMTPGGLAVEGKAVTARPFLEAHPTILRPSPLSMDIAYPYDPLRGWPQSQLDEEFLRSIANFDTVAGYRHLPLSEIAALKRGLNRRKDRKDSHLIQDHLDSARTK